MHSHLTKKVKHSDEPRFKRILASLCGHIQALHQDTIARTQEILKRLAKDTEEVMEKGIALLESGEEVLIRRSAWCKAVNLNDPARLRQWPERLDYNNPLNAFFGSGCANINFGTQ